MSNFGALGRMSLTVGASCTGTMPKLAERMGQNRLTGFVDSTLRGVGMAGFVNNPLSGLLFVCAASTISPWLACALISGAIIATATAIALGLDAHDIRAGLYGYNGALVGGGLSTFLAPSWNMAVACYIVLGAAFSTFVMAALIHVMARTWGVPPVALPFNIVLLGFLLASRAMDHGHAGPMIGTAASSATGQTVHGLAPGNPANIGDHINSVLHGVGQVAFADSPIAIALVLLGVALCCWQTAVLAIVGSATATTVAVLVGLNNVKLGLGLYGLNGFLTCVALSCIFLPRRTPFSIAFGVVGAAASTIAAAALDNVLGVFGLPGSITLGYCTIAPLMVGVKYLSARLAPHAAQQVSA